MENSKQVIQLAKQSAIYKFSVLVQRMAQDTDNSLLAALSKNATSAEHRNLTTARQFLHKQGNELLRHIESLFREQMERALRTMYTDLREDLGKFSAETMTLLDDEAVNRQIEVGHLVDRLRDSCDENLGRMNIMIAQLHGKSEVRERENPFRPYLIARTLHDALREMIREEEVTTLLYKYFADSLAKYLPEYYSELCEVFDAGGVKALLVARPGTLKRHQREQLQRQLRGAHGGGGTSGGGAAAVEAAIPVNLAKNVMPTLERLLKAMQQQAVPGKGATTQSAPLSDSQTAASFHDFVSNIFNQFQESGYASGYTAPGQPARQDPYADRGEQAAEAAASAVSDELLAKLNEFQGLAARGRAVNEEITPLQNQLFSVREQINEQVTGQPERMSIDVIAVLFEFILGDEQIPEALRAQIGRLQIPFLKAAMLDPSLLQQLEHPCRRLLNRMGSIAVGLATDTEVGQGFVAEIKRIVRKILDEFDKDIAIFSTCLEELDQFMAGQLRKADTDTALSIEAMEEAEKVGGLTFGTTLSLREILLPLNADKRVADFIIETWTRVLVRASLQDIKKDGAGQAGVTQKPYLDVLPELVWSAQEKQSTQERHDLMKLLPNLVKTLKSGLAILNLSVEESKHALDKLVEVHAQILRSHEIAAKAQLPTLDELRQAFAGLTIHEEESDSKAVALPQIDASLIEESLAARGVAVSMDFQRESTFSSRLDEAWLSQMQVGTCVECWVDNAYQQGRLIWVGKNQTIFMFRLDVNSKPLVYSKASLNRAINEGLLNTVEAVPTFERAVESLLQGTEAVKQVKTFQ